MGWGILPSLPYPIDRPVRMYYVVVIFRDRELSACCTDIKYTRTLYVEHLINSAGPKVRFSAASARYVRRTSVYVRNTFRAYKRRPLVASSHLHQLSRTVLH